MKIISIIKTAHTRRSRFIRRGEFCNSKNELKILTVVLFIRKEKKMNKITVYELDGYDIRKALANYFGVEIYVVMNYKDANY